MKKIHLLLLAIAGCLTACVKNSTVSSATTTPPDVPTKTAAKSLYMAQTAGDLQGISISYDSVGNALTILYNPTVTPYGITVTSIFNSQPLYSNSAATAHSIVINTHLQPGDIVTVTVTDNGDTETASLTIGGSGATSTPTPPPGRFYINVTSNLAYTQLNVTWTYSGGNPNTAGNYYIYFGSYCPDRNVSHTNISAVSAGAAKYTYTWDRPYTTYDSAYITVMIKGVSIPSNDPTAHFFDNGSKGSYIYLSNLLIPQTYSGNFQNLVYPWVLYSYDGCNGPCLTPPVQP